MLAKTNGTDALLRELYQAGSPFLDEYPWEFERDRWAELLTCCLIVAVGVDSSIAKDAVETLTRLGMIGVNDLAAATPEQRAFVKRIFIQHGCDDDGAAKASDTAISLASVIERNWNGYLQRFLRQHGEKMAKELSTVLKTAGIADRAADKTAVLWLQNVANAPILLPGDPYIQQFCSEHQLTDQDLVNTADRLGLNLSVLDDLLALEATAAEEEEPKTSVKKVPPKAAGR